MKLNPANLSIIKRLLVGRSSRPLLSILSRLEPADLASIFSHLNQRESLLLVDALISLDRASEVLVEIPEPRLERILAGLEQKTLLSIVVYSDLDDSAYLIGLLPPEQREFLIQSMESPRRAKILQYLEYPEDSVGRIMQSQVFTIETDMTAAEGLQLLRSKAQEEPIYYIYCVNQEHQLIGVLSLRLLATAPSDKRISEIIKREVVTVTPQTPAAEAANLVAHYDFIALPVIDKDRHLVGVITVDDVLDIIQGSATANIYAQAGLTQTDRVYTPMWTSVFNRSPWMILNLFLAGLASTVVSLFEDTMSHLILLATLKNVVAGLGGNTAIQSLTVVTRGLATEDFNFISTSRAILKESLVGIIIGLLTGALAGILSYLWKGDELVSVVIFIAMVLNCFLGSIAGAVVPVALKRMGRDPAIGSGVLVTMFTDIFGFLAFLGIAALGLALVGKV